MLSHIKNLENQLDGLDFASWAKTTKWSPRSDNEALDSADRVLDRYFVWRFLFKSKLLSEEKAGSPPIAALTMEELKKLPKEDPRWQNLQFLVVNVGDPA